MGKTTWRAGSASGSSMIERASSAAARPMSSTGWATVVRSSHSARRWSSKPSTDIRPGMSTPEERRTPHHLDRHLDQHLVGLGEDGGGRVAQAQQLADGLADAAAVPGDGVEDQLLVVRQPGLLQCLAVADEPFLGAPVEAGVVAGLEEGDAPARVRCARWSRSSSRWRGRGCSRPGLFTFTATWAEFLLALTFNSEDAFRTVQGGMTLFTSQYTVPYGTI
nr:hypothetical protein [Streptomyces antioxidans]